ncbi:MAG TPA: ThiF family adenylyltransferase [Pyrinomonadaceae bacterium]|jgi:molybdopterin/thiamine biosynthesis adenylyltransferase|nr:ThiF family adenylyltransferase [Pyrinomonadaceae bacterium]
MSIFFHEQLYRSAELMARVRELPVTVCGAGALGANITESLARSGFTKLCVVDRDRVEERNLSTQPYYVADVGAFKAKVLAHALYRAVRADVSARCEELTTDNAGKFLGESALVLDAFDNSASRRAVKDYCLQANVPCLHAGLAGDYSEVIWNEIYRVPSAAQDDVCDYPLARNLVMLTVAIACEVIIAYVATGEQQSFTATLRDLAVKPFNLN